MLGIGYVILMWHTLGPPYNYVYKFTDAQVMFQWQVQEDHRTIGRFCGSILHATFTTEANRLLITFETDIFISGKGFEAIYHQAKGIYNVQYCMRTC